MRKSVSLNNLSEYESTEETLKIVGEDGDGQAKNKTSSCYASADDAVPVSANRERKRVPWTEEEHKLFLLGLERVHPLSIFFLSLCIHPLNVAMPIFCVLLPSISLMRSAQVSHCVCYLLCVTCRIKEEVKSKRAHKEVCNSSSRMSVVYSLIVREEEVLMEQRKRECGGCLRDNIRSIYQ
ncbi:uncharacterized protein LOC130512574 isoform X3 [Raphanus sativus]|uniref:Uncharacterized protein LOC130512574 isoform X3 n=1 Tax=Raphanus sativus TaxID=3726 RepID=A0A9W3DSI4_RAPSA|nr:uncharacterized protein LOC130512574 isoform X3 [Raphanus sativus]